GVHAALTGHLVLTTLHTNTASGAITRMIDMGVESFLLASSVRAIIGQRLVRVLCDHCKRPKQLNTNDVSQDHRLGALGLKAGDTICEPVGCEWCGSTGYRGRQGIFEVLEVTKAVRAAIGPKTDAVELERVAQGEGMLTMVADGAAKCRAGRTSVEEVFRVTAS